ncbi:hypothetical protein [Clostridium intestinale]|uniref:Uncharacterized protein n=1 Tax=Clostridium intestinale TaxID=36845 RepID=A0A7D6ZMS4_9CLOT|nr:hypothetical protein [Clostridium intestinale]QLY78063.1 hypothetical protein HZF06_13270 [Clostridium intestinale]
MTEKERILIESIKLKKKEYPSFYRGIKIFMIIIIFSPIIIWICYRLGKYNVIIPTDTSEGEYLAFWGTFLSFISTLGLGVLALWQNINANRINNRLSIIEEKRFKLDFQPFIVVKDWDIQKTNNLLQPDIPCIQISDMYKCESYGYLTLTFKNTSNTYAVIEYVEGNVYHNDKLLESLTNNCYYKKDYKIHLEREQEGALRFYCSVSKMIKFNNNKLRLKFVITNKLGDRYKETIDIFIHSIVLKNNKQWYASISSRTCGIEKYNEKMQQYEIE